MSGKGAWLGVEDSSEIGGKDLKLTITPGNLVSVHVWSGERRPVRPA